MTANTNGSYTQLASPMKSYFLSVLAIVASAAPAVWLAWLATSALELQGIPMALATALLAMVIAVGFFSLLVAVGKKVGVVK